MGNADFIRHSYTITKRLKTYDVFTLVDVKNGTKQLTNLLRIEQFRNFSEATGIKEYLRLRTCGNWSKCEKVTGLRPTKRPGVYYGDRVTIDGKKSLLIFTYNQKRDCLTIDYFRSYYPFKKGQLLNLISAHTHPTEIKKGGVQPSLNLFKCYDTGNASQDKNSH